MGDGAADLARVMGLIGRPFDGPTPPDLGSHRRTHVYVLDDIVVKCDDRLGSYSMWRERSALRLLAGTGLPVAEVVAWGDFDDGRRWIVLSRLPGAPPADATERLAHALSPDLAGQLGGIAARLHAAVEPPGFGTWERDPRRTLAEEEQGRTAALVKMAEEAGIVPMTEVRAVEALLQDTLEPVAAVARPVLVHRDLQPRNVLVEDGRVCALLDFESGSGGDPAEDFRVVGLDWTGPAFSAFADAYGQAGGRLGHDGAERVAHHILGWALVVFSYLGAFAPAYIEPARLAVERLASGERPVVPR